ncbi:MAG TPA: pantetheine-phosphate adenylyltransferase [Candidatus Limiplasma sp.]|nr:pantetheine-phosphate adenylyltransferase [Candidatus Limiplasma sp.]HRX08745.1 pantetheine-phosphate adenylyltransferase [Candidatus Limiplasma sp.]
MKPNVCVYPGSFDPVTLGHLDIIKRACAIFAEVRVAVLNNPDKTKAFSVEERIAMLEKACQNLPNVRIDSFSGLLVSYMRKTGAGIVIRGLRSAGDFETEFQMAQMNSRLNESVESLFMMTSPGYAYISSSIIKQIASFGGDISAFVPDCILPEIIERFQNR